MALSVCMVQHTSVLEYELLHWWFLILASSFFIYKSMFYLSGEIGSINVALFANFQRDVLDANVFICQSLLYLRRERFNTFHSTDHSLNTFNNNNNKKINRKALLNNFHLNAAIHRLKGLNQSRSKALLTIYSVIGMWNIREKGKYFSSLYL